MGWLLNCHNMHFTFDQIGCHISLLLGSGMVIGIRQNCLSHELNLKLRRWEIWTAIVQCPYKYPHKFSFPHISKAHMGFVSFYGWYSFHMLTVFHLNLSHTPTILSNINGWVMTRRMVMMMVMRRRRMRTMTRRRRVIFLLSDSGICCLLSFPYCC